MEVGNDNEAIKPLLTESGIGADFQSSTSIDGVLLCFRSFGDFASVLSWQCVTIMSLDTCSGGIFLAYVQSN